MVGVTACDQTDQEPVKQPEETEEEEEMAAHTGLLDNCDVGATTVSDACKDFDRVLHGNFLVFYCLKIFLK